MKKFIISFVIFLLLNGSIFSQKLQPKNETIKDTSLIHFIDKLKFIIEHKDKEYLLNIINKKIQNSCGDNSGIANFKLIWKINSPNTDIWRILKRITDLGGYFTTNKWDEGISYTFPYTSGLELKNIQPEDYFSLLVITLNNLELKEKPDEKSKTLAVLSYDVVWNELHVDLKSNEWYLIRSFDKKIKGYVKSNYVQAVTDYQMVIKKIKGKWEITHFLQTCD